MEIERELGLQSHGNLAYHNQEWVTSLWIWGPTSGTYGYSLIDRLNQVHQPPIMSSNIGLGVYHIIRSATLYPISLYLYLYLYYYYFDCIVVVVNKNSLIPDIFSILLFYLLFLLSLPHCGSFPLPLTVTVFGQHVEAERPDVMGSPVTS